MTRRVIEISPFKGANGAEVLTIRLLEPADIYPDSDVSVELACSAQDADFTALAAKALTKNAIRRAGTRLRQSLTGQGAIEQALQGAIAEAKLDNAPVPIYFLLRDKTEPIEGLPWESLWDKQGDFLALDARWPIGRMSGGQVGKPDVRTFSPPIRMLVFLAATQIEARAEWEALYSALTAAQVPVRLTVYLCEPDLATHIEGLPRDEHVEVEARFLPSPFDFANLIPNADHAPHIIHFFCHGTTVDGPTLLLATLTDWEHGLSSIALGPEDFRSIPGLRDHLWLVTLNCCESAATADQETRSFARTLVTEVRVPAVVAMREAVEVEAANLFCRGLYTALFRAIAPALANGGAAIPIEWAGALIDPRGAIVKEHPSSKGKKASTVAASSKAWTLPVIYARAGEFKLSRVTPSATEQPSAAEQRRTVEGLRRVIANLPEGVPQEAIDRLRQTIADLEAGLAPA